MTIVDPLNGEPFIKVAETQLHEIEPFVKSLRMVPKSGLHNPLKNPERCDGLAWLGWRGVRQDVNMCTTRPPAGVKLGHKCVKPPHWRVGLTHVAGGAAGKEEECRRGFPLHRRFGAGSEPASQADGQTKSQQACLHFNRD
jgi:hypothetical protein